MLLALPVITRRSPAGKPPKPPGASTWMIDSSVRKPPYHSIEARQNNIACGAVSRDRSVAPDVVSADTDSNHASIQFSPASVLNDTAANIGTSTHMATSAT